MLLSVLLSCASSGPEVGARVLDAPSAPTQPVVRLADGGRLLGGDVPPTAAPGEWVEVRSRVQPASVGGAVEVALWAPGAEEPAATATLEAGAAWPAGAAAGGAVVEHALALDLPRGLEPGPYTVTWRLRDAAGESVEAAPFRKGRVPLGVVQVGGPALEAAAAAGGQGPVLAASGDLGLGRRLNLVVSQEGPASPLAGVPALRGADLAFANLESNLGDRGAPVEKGEAGEFYFRGRPELAAVLLEAGIDVVGTANNHGGDYGPEALLHQGTLLAAAGIGAPGAGSDEAAACAPVLRRAGELVVAFYSLDATQPGFAAGPGRPGTCHRALDQPEAWTALLAPSIAAVRSRADLVLVAVHWGDNNGNRPTEARRAVGQAIVEAGADAVLGSSAHRVQGIELHDGRPILYDMGNLLFDSVEPGEHQRGAVFLLELDPSGVRRVRALPLSLGMGRTEAARDNDAAAVLLRLRDLSAELGSVVRLAEGEAVLDLPVPSPRAAPTEAAEVAGPAEGIAAPAALPPPGCLADAVPAEAAIPPRRIGPWELVGVRLSPARVVERDHARVETWWRVLAPAPADLLIAPALVATFDPRRRNWDDPHQPCDWAWPADRFPVGALVHDEVLVRPPMNLQPGRYALEVGLYRDIVSLGGFAGLAEITVAVR